MRKIKLEEGFSVDDLTTEIQQKVSYDKETGTTKRAFKTYEREVNPRATTVRFEACKTLNILQVIYIAVYGKLPDGRLTRRDNSYIGDLHNKWNNIYFTDTRSAPPESPTERSLINKGHAIELAHQELQFEDDGSILTGALPRGIYQTGRRWQVQRTIDGVSVYVGRFDTPKDAYSAYNDFSRQYVAEVNPAIDKAISEIMTNAHSMLDKVRQRLMQLRAQHQTALNNNDTFEAQRLQQYIDQFTDKEAELADYQIPDWHMNKVEKTIRKRVAVEIRKRYNKQRSNDVKTSMTNYQREVVHAIQTQFRLSPINELEQYYSINKYAPLAWHKANEGNKHYTVRMPDNKRIRRTYQQIMDVINPGDERSESPDDQ